MPMAAPIATATPSAGPAPAGTSSAPRADGVAQNFLNALTVALQPSDRQGTNPDPSGPPAHAAATDATIEPETARVEPDVGAAPVMSKSGARPIAAKTPAAQRPPDADVATIVPQVPLPPVPPSIAAMPGPPESPGEGPTPEIGDAAVVPSGAALRHGPPPGADPPPASATPVPPVAPPVVAVGGPLPPASTAPASSPTGVPVPRAGQATSLGPAAQAGAAFVMLARQPGEAQSLTLHLQPPDLGRLAINIEQP